MSYIFSLVPQPQAQSAATTPKSDIPAATNLPSANAPNPRAEQRTAASGPLAASASTSPSTSTFPNDSFPPPLWNFSSSGAEGGVGGVGGGINPVLAFYARRLTSQTESLSSLLQNSLSEITQKQTSLAELLRTSDTQVKHLEGKVSEVVGRVGVEVEQILIQLRGVLSTTNSVLLAIDGKIVEVESGSVGLVRRVARIEREVGGVREGVERVERVVLGMQRRLDGLVEVVDGLVSSAASSSRSTRCGCSGENSNNKEKVKNIGGNRKRMRRRTPSFDIPCSILGGSDNTLSAAPDAAESDLEEAISGGTQAGYKTTSTTKKRRLISDNEIMKMEMEELRRERDVEAAEYAYTEEPDININGDGLDQGGFSIAIDDQELDVPQEGLKIVDENPNRVAATAAVVQIPKKRILLSTQELEGLLE